MQCGALLGKFLAVREPNIRYLGLETMARLAARPGMHAVVQMHQVKVSELLKDQDVSIRKRALDMLFVMCSPSTVQAIMAQLLDYLGTCAMALREELVLKMAVLAERHAADRLWCAHSLTRARLHLPP